MTLPFPAKTVAGAAFCMLGCFQATAQTANNYHTWVAGAGTDIDSCGAIQTPCRSMGYGISKTIAGGEVQCLDALDFANFPGSILSKSITITCDAAKWSNSVANGIYDNLTIDIGANDTVIIRGMKLDGARHGFNGLDFMGAGTLVLDNVQITGYSTGILFRPSGFAKLVVSNSLIAMNGDFARNVGAGIRVVPQGSGSGEVSVSRTDLSHNVFGMAADGSESSPGINVTVMDSVVSSNTQDGVIAVSTRAPIATQVINTKSVNNAYGIRSIGSGVTVRVETSKILGNAVGLAYLSGGALLSAGNNLVEANSSNGAFSGAIALK